MLQNSESTDKRTIITMKREDQSLLEKIEGNRFLTAADRQLLIDRWRDSAERLAFTQAQLQQKEEVIRERDQLLLSLEKRLQDIEHSATQKDKFVLEREEQINIRNRRLEEKDQHISKRDREIENRDKQIAKRDANISELSQQLTALSRWVHDQQQRLYSHAQLLQERGFNPLPTNKAGRIARM